MWQRRPQRRCEPLGGEKETPSQEYLLVGSEGEMSTCQLLVWRMLVYEAALLIIFTYLHLDFKFYVETVTSR